MKLKYAVLIHISVVLKIYCVFNFYYVLNTDQNLDKSLEDRKQWSLGVRQRRKKFWNRYIKKWIQIQSIHFFFLILFLSSFLSDVVWPLLPTHSRCRVIVFIWSHSLTQTPRSVGLLWTMDRTVAEISTWQYTTFARGSHPCLRRK